MKVDTAIAVVGMRYPGWKIGWWTDGERCGIEATRRVSYARFARMFGAGPTWTDALSEFR